MANYIVPTTIPAISNILDSLQGKKYMAIEEGQRTTSGTDKKGRPKPARLQLPWSVNRTLKNAALGAATSAVNQKANVFRGYYERMLSDGIMPSNARHAVARKLLAVMWGMWKTNSRFDESLCRKPDSKTATVLSR